MQIEKEEVVDEVIEQPVDSEGEGVVENPEGQEEEVVVTIGDEEPEEKEPVAAPEWVRELRKNHREAQKRIRELEAQVTGGEKKPEALGKKPTLEDFDYDADKFELALTDWHEKRRNAEAEAERAAKEQEEAARTWQEKLASYGAAKTTLKVKDYDDAESAVLDMLDVTKQGIIVQGADNPALVVYAIGKNHAKLKELAEIKDPIKFAFAISKLEAQLKVQNKKAPPAPEKPITGTGKISGSVDSTLERLRVEAEKTGDMSKVMAYKRQKKQK